MWWILAVLLAVSGGAAGWWGAGRGAGGVWTRQLYREGFSRAGAALCPREGTGLRLLVLVASPPPNIPHRAAIRYTWGHFLRRRDVAFGFVLGATNDSKVTALLHRENGDWGDLIVTNNIDHPETQSLKTLSMLEWTLQYCPRAPRILKCDDDVFVNVPMLLQLVSDTVDTYNGIWGHVETSDIGWPHAHGSAYLLSSELVYPLAREALRQRYSPREAALFTGWLARNVSAELTHDARFARAPLSPLLAATVSGVTPVQQLSNWRQMFSEMHDLIYSPEHIGMDNPFIQETLL
ncbi:N-acetyllactosaminide beta-1,3-N-acetylglucosaminyltransferase 4-like [Plutella xylostella]|uniref:N-acetyllactosaminide beta-1,3-N-acetylglucosaminyltransferase 4-like n=1 Tax=Plutella xylostella TaxID=51655 RepID=UPI0018D18575|nr:N-acetyllactosaminide beta-1,3-N-acetylglucosaminyltransferase 4-like [Plutella xylostella]